MYLEHMCGLMQVLKATIWAARKFQASCAQHWEKKNLKEYSYVLHFRFSEIFPPLPCYYISCIFVHFYDILM